MLQRGRLLLDEEIDDDLVLRIVEWLARDLSRLPRDGYSRQRLSDLVSPEILGSTGLPAIAAMVPTLFRRPVTPRTVTPIDERARACSPEDLHELFRRGVHWLAQERPIVMGKRRFPAQSLNVPAEQAVAGLSQMVEHMGCRLEDDGDVQTMEACVALSAAIAPLSSDSNEDLLVLRLAAASLAAAGRVQRARDLAEQGLTMAGDNPQQRRLAWWAFADVYAGLGNLGESLIALACCAVADTRPSWDQIWTESLVQLRVFRDLGMLMLAKPLLIPARTALTEMRAKPRYFVRMETVDLQIRLLEYDDADANDPAQVSALVRDLSRNVRQTIDLCDEIEPAAALLANALRLAAEQEVPVPESSAELLSEALALVSPPFKTLIQATGALHPSVDHLLPLARRMESARHSADVGFDVPNLVIAAKRVLGQGIDATDAIYATELLTDQATALSGGAGESRFLGVERDGPASAALALSRLGVAVVTLGTGAAGLVRVAASEGSLHGPFTESRAVFSEARLHEWATDYPYGYRQVQDVNEFYISTSGVGVSDIPDRAVVVASTEMQAYPPNLLNVADDLAGRSRRLASAPSLAWLKAAIEKPRKLDGRITAWIPDAAPEGELTSSR